MRQFLTVLLGPALMLTMGALAVAQPGETISYDFKAITPQLRREVDARALHQPAESATTQNIQFYSGLTGWLLSRTPLSAAEEVRRAKAAHSAVIKKWHVVPTPRAADAVMVKLVAQLPARFRSENTRFSLTVLDQPQWQASTVGGGYLYITRPYLEALLAGGQGGADMLAFVLGRQLGHICRLHCRRGYQLIVLKEALDQRLKVHVNGEQLRRGLSRTVQITGGIIRFLYTQNQVDEADLFALHLCRNTGFQQETCLDVLRGSVFRRDNELLPTETPLGLETDSFTDKSALQRLKRLRMELDGRVDGDRYGLFRFDTKTAQLKRIADGAIAGSSRVIVLVHGMESDLEPLRQLARDLLPLAKKNDVQVLGFQYASDASLARMSRFLEGEINRVCESAEHFDFVCHSAGGLVFRYYAEQLGGRFHKAVFIGTPHAGSDIAGLQSLLEAMQFLGDLELGYPQALEQAIIDGRGQMGFDLQPESLFLRYLDRGQSQVKRYSIIRGRALSSEYAVLVRTSLIAIRQTLGQQLKNLKQEGFLRQAAQERIERLRLPAEIYRGDLAVTLESAALQGVTRIKTLDVHHLKLVADVKAREFVKDCLFAD